MQGAVAPGCGVSSGRVPPDGRRRIRDAVIAADEAARQADVFPGDTPRHAARGDGTGWTDSGG